MNNTFSIDKNRLKGEFYNTIDAGSILSSKGYGSSDQEEQLDSLSNDKAQAVANQRIRTQTLGFNRFSQGIGGCRNTQPSIFSSENKNHPASLIEKSDYFAKVNPRLHQKPRFIINGGGPLSLHKQLTTTVTSTRNSTVPATSRVGLNTAGQLDSERMGSLGRTQRTTSIAGKPTQLYREVVVRAKPASLYKFNTDYSQDRSTYPSKAVTMTLMP